MAGDFDESSNLLYTLRALVEATDHPISRQEFARFSQMLHSRIISLRDTGWAPHVTLAERPEFERAVQATGVPNFHITDRDANGHVRIAADRPDYFPILLSEGDPNGLRFVGLDVAFEPNRRAAIAGTVATGRPAATPPVRLLTAPGPNGGLMSYLALQGKAGDGTPEIKGVVVGAFDIVAMIDNIVATKAQLTGMDVYFFQPGAPLQASANYAHVTGQSAGPLVTQAFLMSRIHWAGAVPIMDQQWTAIFVPTKASRRLSWGWQATMPLIIGFTMTAMIVAYLLVSLRRTAQLEALTTSLNRTAEELRRNMGRISHMARHDQLTDLPNRVVFKERLDEAVAQIGRNKRFALLFIDLDRFKQVNDTLGHATGDQLLCRATERMRACLRQGDTLARMGGDEFAMILRDTAAPTDAVPIVERLIAVVSEPYRLNDDTVVIGASIGIADAPDDGDLADLLQIRADLALYAAKAAGRGTWRRFSDLHQIAPVQA